MEPLNKDLMVRCLNFHGQQLQKVWDAERSEELARYNIKDLDYMQYAQRQKHLSFQDRGKRLKLHQFIVKKSNMLFSPSVLDNITKSESQTSEDIFAVMPPFETFLNCDKQFRLRYFFEQVRVGDLLLGTIVSKTPSGMMLKVLCTSSAGNTVRYVADINIKAFCPVANMINAIDRKGVNRSYMMNDSVCCEVLEVIPDTDKMVCGMKGSTRQPGDPEPRPALGLITAEDFPLEYKKALDNKGENYDAVLEKSVGFNNPNNIAYLSNQMGITTTATSSEHCSLMKGLKGRFPEQEYANELRQVQASKWAFRSVADGIDHFKAGRHTEAFQCLNKALTIDPKNVEGLVARGALFANSGNFQKAIEDFETALKLNPSHANARKYMGETLVALGRSYEDENKLDEARKAYQSCLTIIPYHEEAQNSLEFLKNKANAPKNLIEPGELLLPNLSANKMFEAKENLMKMIKPEEPEKKEKKKKSKKSKKRKKRDQSSSSSSSSSSGSSHSSSSSSSSSSDSSSGSSDSEKRKKKRRHRRDKQKSLSPLSKRMQMMDGTHETPSNYQFNKPNSSFQFGFDQLAEAPPAKNADEEYETKVRSFLEQTKGDSDYEEKVRKFLEETARWKKEKKNYDKKKKKKRDKKAKKESKRKRKDKKLRHKDFDLHDLEEQIDNKKLRDVLKKELGIKDKHKKRSSNNITDVGEFLLQNASLLNDGDLDDLESKLRDYYALEKESKRSNSMSQSPNRVTILDSPSPTREQKARQAVAEASASASGLQGKWKMQMGANVPGSSRFKKRPEREEWGNEQEEKGPKPPPQMTSEEKAISIRKAMALKEPLPKKESYMEQKFKPKAPPITKQPIINPGQVVLDKFGSFRLLSPKKINEDDLPPLPPGAPPKSSYHGRGNKPPEPPGKPRTMSRSPKRKTSRSRSRGKYSRNSSRSSSASRSRGRSRSRSYRSRSRSYYSRSGSRSRSRSYYSRSRSRSRSYSGDRRRMHDRRGGGFRGRYNDRGTYYKPRFQNFKNNRGYNRGGRGGYRDNRDFNNRDYRDNRGRGGRYFYNNNRGRRQRGGRFRGGGGNNFRDYRDRRYDRSRSRDISRDRSISRENEDTMKKVNEEKEKINKYLDNGDEVEVKHDGPLSEGEDRDDYNSSDKFVDRQSYDGKWAEKEDHNKDGGKNQIETEN